VLREFKTLREKDVLNLAMKGLCEIILKASLDDIDKLNEQYSELYTRRMAIIAAELEAPFDCD